MTDRIMVKQSPSEFEIYRGEPLELRISACCVN
jgi:hypothetical protein